MHRQSRRKGWPNNRLAHLLMFCFLSVSPLSVSGKGIGLLWFQYWLPAAPWLWTTGKPPGTSLQSVAPQVQAASKAGRGAAAAPPAAATAATAAPSVDPLTTSIKQDVLKTAGLLADDLVTFWTRHGPDKEQGGFFGSVDQRGAPVAPYEKGLVNQARRLWTWSTYFADMSQQYPDMADAAYQFLALKLIQRQPGKPTLAVWAVSRDGSNATDPSLSLYGNMFAVFALAKYGQVFKKKQAASLALEVFRSIDDRWHDKAAGGYDETTSQPVFDLHYLPKTSKTTKSFDTQMHSIEALGQLYVTTRDPTVLSRLLEMLNILDSKAIVTLNDTESCNRVRDWLRPASSSKALSLAATSSPTNSSGWISLQHLLSSGSKDITDFMADGQLRTASPWHLDNCSFICAGFDLAWGCLPSTNNPILVNLGHNLEAVHLFTSIINSLLELRAIQPDLAASLKQKLVHVGVTTAAWGFDDKYGGLTQPGYFAKLPPYTKVYWVQAETMQALWLLYSSTGDPKYLKALQQTINFVNKHMRDAQYGEWFYQVLANGSLPANPGPLLKSLATSKADYHEMRSLMNLINWVKASLMTAG